MTGSAFSPDPSLGRAQQGGAGALLVERQQQGGFGLVELVLLVGQLLGDAAARRARLDGRAKLSQLAARAPQLGQQRLRVERRCQPVRDAAPRG